VKSAYVRRAAQAWPDVRRRALHAGLFGAIRFIRRGGSYHAAALTYYSIFSFFPAGALVYALLGIFGARSVIDEAVDALERRDVESQFVDALAKTLESAVNQRSDEAGIVVAISVGTSIYLASRWIRGVARGLDAVLEREYERGGFRFLKQLRDTLVLLLLFIGALVLLFVGAGLANDLFGDALSLLWEIGVYLLAALLAAGAYAYIYWFVPSPPRPTRDALLAGAIIGMLIWVLASVGFRIFADLWPGYDTNYGVFATLIVAVIWLWLTNVSVLLGGSFASEWSQNL